MENLELTAFARYDSGFNAQEIDYHGYGKTLTPANARKVIKQIVDHVNESEDLITPLDANEPTAVKRSKDEVSLEWLAKLNDRGHAETIILTVECVGK